MPSQKSKIKVNLIKLADAIKNDDFNERYLGITMEDLVKRAKTKLDSKPKNKCKK